MALIWVGVALATLLFLKTLLKKLEPTPTSFSGRPCQPLKLRKDPYILGIHGIIRAIKSNVAGRLPLAFIELFNDLGHTFGVKRFGVRSIMTCDHRNIQAMLATQFDDFGLAHERRAHQAILGTRGIFTQDGPEWKESRALLRPSFDRASVADLSALESFVTRMIAKISASPGSNGYHEVDLQALLLELTMDASTDFLFGSPIGAQEGTVSAEGEMSFSDAFDISQDVVSIRFTLNDLYWLVNPKRFRLAITVVHKLVGHYVTRALQKHSSSSGADKLYTKDSSTSGKYIFLEALSQKTQNPQVLQDQILSVMMAGRDTTASTLTWAFHVLACHPEVLQKLRKEILDTIGLQAPMQSDLREMVYLRYFLHEVLRMYPPVGINSRSALRTTTLPYGGGADGNAPIVVRKGERVMYSVFAVHRREDVYGPDAGTFRPERWGEEAMRKVGWAWLPFNGGPRVCLGQQMALTMVGYVLVRVLQAFGEVRDIGVPGGEEVRYAVKIIMVPGQGLKVKMR